MIPKRAVEIVERAVVEARKLYEPQLQAEKAWIKKLEERIDVLTAQRDGAFLELGWRLPD